MIEEKTVKAFVVIGILVLLAFAYGLMGWAIMIR
jgi:hypothetical protein